MDDNYPTLKRPKKKLVFPTTKTRVFDQWPKDIITLEDVDKMFDNLDSRVEELPSPSPEIHIPNKNKHVERDVSPLPPSEELLKCQMVANGDHTHPHHTPASPDLDMETPFKAHGPVKTSSPIEGNEMQHKEKCKGDSSASPILFDCEDENEDLETAERQTEKPQHNRRDEHDDSDTVFETLPKKSMLDKMSAQKKNTDQKRSKPSSLPIFPVKSDLKAAPSAPEKPTENVQLSTKVKSDMASFLQKLKDAKQAKPAQISQAKVMPQLPQPEDDFLILEDDVPFYVSIPNKNSKSTKEKRTKTSCTDAEAKGTTGEEPSADKEQDNEQNHRQQESETLAEKTNKKTANQISESNPVVSVKDQPLLATTETDSVEKLSTTTKKKRMKKVQSKVDDKPEDTDTERDDGVPSKKMVKGEKTVKKQSKPLKNDKENAQKKMTTTKENKRGVRKPSADEVKGQNKELNFESPLDNDAPVSGLSNGEAGPTEDLADVNLGQNMPSSQEQTSDEDQELGKRKRKQPRQWWLISPESPEHQAREKQPVVKKTKQTNKKSSPASSSVKAAIGGGKKNLKSSSSSDSQRQRAEKNKVKKGKLKSKKPVKTTSSDKSDEVLDLPIQDRALDQDSNSDSSPLLFVQRERSISSGKRAFHKVYQNGASEKKSSSPDRASTTRPEGSRESPKRIRKSPGNWWQVNPAAEDQEVISSPPQLQNPKKTKTTVKKKKQSEKPAAPSPSQPVEGAAKHTKRSLATTADLFSTVVSSPPANKKKVATLKKQNKVTTPPAEDVEANHNVSVHFDELREAQDQSPNTALESMSKVIRSGPSSMIGLENYEEDDDTAVLPSTTVQPALCASDLCSAPLRPLILQPKDEVNIRDWLKCLWPAADRNPEITPDHFEWYCHRGKAMGILTDLQTGSICTGKMLLGSSMKKPLWVDHSATTVFNLLTGSVSVVMDCNKSHYSAGQSFMVPPGHAYSIHNLNAQPVVLYFTRFFTDELDE